MATASRISKRIIKRRQRSGELVTLPRYILAFRDPKTKKRTQKFFERQKDAQAAQSQILVEIDQGYYADRREAPTVAEAFDHWIEDRRGQVKNRTLEGYKSYRRHVTGPLEFGQIKVTDLMTSQIRVWHKHLCDAVGPYIANRSQSCLKTCLSLAAEDFNVRPPAMPRRTGRGRPKQKKAILTPAQATTLLEQAKNDKDYGLYYAFGFLTGTRPSEQLALLWENVDLDKRTIRICRMQEKDGTIFDFTKTVAGTRTLPISGMLYDMLVDWKERCPRREGQPHRVFPNIGFRRFKPEPRSGGGNCLLYTNFRKRVWHVALKKAGLPPVAPHSARHFFISTLQAQGVEIGLVAKLAGHANAVITLSHYTQAIRGGEEAVEALTKAFHVPGANNIAASTPA